MQESESANDIYSNSKINWEELLYKYRLPLLLFLIAVILIGLGIFYANNFGSNNSKIEVLETAEDNESDVIIEVSGAVLKPGVYKLKSDDRVENALISAGGLSADADRDWMEKYLNRAAKLSDGQKIFIPTKSMSNKQSDVISANIDEGYQTISSSGNSQTESYTNINTASQKALEELPGIGPVYAKNIIDHRPYSNIEELLSKEVLKKNTFEKIKNSITVF